MIFFSKIKKDFILDDYKKNIKRFIKLKTFYFLINSTKPISKYYGLERGNSIDRYYIDKFLEKNKNKIRGNCLEILNNNYTTKYGISKNIKSDVLDIEKENKKANIIDDLRNLKKISDNTYNCIILTQVLQFIDDLDSAISECFRILKPGGVLLATLPSISRIDCVANIKGDFWRFTKASAKFLFEKQFESSKLDISSFGNAKSGAYFFVGFSQEDVSQKILEENDQNFPVIITVRAQKNENNN